MKKIFVGISALGSIIFVLLLYARQIGICATYSYSTCSVTTDALAQTLSIFVVFFIISCGTYFLRDEIFSFWSKFAIPGAILSMILIYITPDQNAGGFGPQLSTGKGDTAIVTSALFVLISLLIIIGQYTYLYYLKRRRA